MKRIIVFLALLVGIPGLLSAETPAQSSGDSGKYLLLIASCNDCHTRGYLPSEGKVEESEWLTGDVMGWSGPWGTTYPPNLRLIIPAMSEEVWVAYSANLKARPPMPWWILRGMKDSDRRSLYRFVKKLGPKGSPAPEYLPPDMKPKPPYASFVFPEPDEAHAKKAAP